MKQDKRTTGAQHDGADFSSNREAGPFVVSRDAMTHTALKCMAPHPRGLHGRICGEHGAHLPAVFNASFTGRTYRKGRTFERDHTLVYSYCHNCGATTEYRIVAPAALERAA